MKCLLVSDLHYTLKQLDWLDRVGDRFDLVVIAGDHLDIASAVSLDAQVVVTLKYLRRLRDKTRVIVSSGNHDLTARDQANEKVAGWMAHVRQLGVPADGDRIEVGDTTVTICRTLPQGITVADMATDAEEEAVNRRSTVVASAVTHDEHPTGPNAGGGSKLPLIIGVVVVVLVIVYFVFMR